MAKITPAPWAYDVDARNIEQPFQMIVHTDGRIEFVLSSDDFDHACKCVNAAAVGFAASVVLLERQLEVARNMLLGVEDRLFILQDFEIRKNRKTSKWEVSHPTIRLEQGFDHPHDAALAIIQAKGEFGKELNVSLTEAYLDRSPPLAPGPERSLPPTFHGTPLLVNPTLDGPITIDEEIPNDKVVHLTRHPQPYSRPRSSRLGNTIPSSTKFLSPSFSGFGMLPETLPSFKGTQAHARLSQSAGNQSRTNCPYSRASSSRIVTARLWLLARR